jgi:hypothetical protein
LARSFGRDIVQDMPVDEFDSTAVTEQMSPVTGARADREPAVFAGRARPVVLSDVELALKCEIDDPSAHPTWFGPTHRADLGGGNKELASLLAHGALVVMLAIPAMLVVAFGIAFVAR